MNPPETSRDLLERLIRRIEDRTARILVTGMGYVGLPLSLEFIEKGFRVTGVEVDGKRLSLLRDGQNYLSPEIPGLRSVIDDGRLTVSEDYSHIAKADCIIICVPTPLDRHRQPDMRYVRESAEQVAQHLKRGQLIVLESTTYPGTTEELILPILETTGLKVGTDFFLAYSPERVDPGNSRFNVKNTPKIVAGVTVSCLSAVSALYSCVVERVITTGSTRTAEMEKLYENIFRAVNIALVNELALLCRSMNINIWEIIELAKTKPYGFMPFYPGPGMGGHCIPIDPFYLTWKAREFDFDTRFIELAGEINTRMPYEIVHIISEALSSRRKSIKGSRILILGVAYKKDVADYRESSSLKILEILRYRGGLADFNDPFIEKIPVNGSIQESVSLSGMADYDCVVIATDHTGYDYRRILEESALIVDTRNALKVSSDPKVFRL